MFLGAPGSGKGTQSQLLASRLGLDCISTGAMLRDAAKRNTPAGFRLRQTLATGALVDDETVSEIVASRILEFHSRSQFHPDGSSQGLILDGFPRTVRQAQKLDQLLDRLGIPGPIVLHLDVPQDVLLYRLARRRQCAKCGAVYNLASGPAFAEVKAGGSRCHLDGGALVERDDDSDGVVARRLAAYESETLPLVEYYRERNDLSAIYRRIDGSLGAAEIGKAVCEMVLFADAALAA
jgi:adenylate kinase